MITRLPGSNACDCNGKLSVPTTENVLATNWLRLRAPAIRKNGRQIVEQDPADDDCRADQRPLAEEFSVEDRDQHRIEDWLQRVDDGCRDRIRVLGSRREEDVGQAHLDCTKQKDREENRRREYGLPQHQRREEQAARQLSEEDGRKRVSLFEAVEHEHACVEDAGQERQRVAQPLTGRQPLKEEAEDADEYDQDGNEGGSIWFLAKNQKHQDHDPNRCGVLQNDRVACGGQLVGDRVERRHAGHGDRADQHSEIKFDLVMGHKNVEADHQAGDQIARAVDGQRIPGNQLHEKAACREAEGGGQHAGGAERAGVGEEVVCIIHIVRN